MKKNYLLLSLLFLLSASFFIGCLDDKDITIDDVGKIEANQIINPDSDESDFISYSSQVIPGQYIVVYKEGSMSSKRSDLDALSYDVRQNVMKEEAEGTLEKHRISAEKISHVYGKAIQGFALRNATQEEIEQLRKDEQVAYIEQDQTVSVSMGGPPGGGGGGGGGNSQTIPWGITRVNGGVSGSGLRAWIIDSGIDLDHPDLNVDVANAANFASGNSANDGNGHGTHVAGTVAAIDNSEGVIGVAAGALVVPVRVLNNAGSGSTSGVIAGVNYVASNASENDVANMSLGGGFNQALNSAVITASAVCSFALAAGNESTDANTKSPASAQGNNIYTIASMTSSNSWSSFSNYGAGDDPVDYIAPGSSIYSTYKGGGYATLSGTSMASPHVCGILLLGNVSNGGTVSGPDGNYTVASH